MMLFNSNLGSLIAAVAVAVMGCTMVIARIDKWDCVFFFVKLSFFQMCVFLISNMCLCVRVCLHVCQCDSRFVRVRVWSLGSQGWAWGVHVRAVSINVRAYVNV